MRRKSTALFATGLVITLMTACGPPTETAPSPPESTITTQAPALPSKDVAVAFFEAWQAGDWEVMEQLSEPAALAEAEAVADLASESWVPELCEGAAGTVHCIWFSEAGTLAIGVQNLEEPHLVTSFQLMDP